MKENAQAIAAEIHRLAESMSRLRSLGVIRSQKVVGDIGEWIAATLFGGVLAESKNQKGWDITCGKKIFKSAHTRRRKAIQTSGRQFATSHPNARSWQL